MNAQTTFETPYIAARITIPCVREPSKNRALVRTPADAHRALADAAQMAQEAFFVLTVDKKNRLIEKHLVTLGVADASLIHQREVFRPAILDSASAVIVAHNHPSGDPAPSAEDLAITRQLVAAGRIVGIRVLDHVIIGRPDDSRPGFFSVREAGLVDFEG